MWNWSVVVPFKTVISKRASSLLFLWKKVWVHFVQFSHLKGIFVSPSMNLKPLYRCSTTTLVASWTPRRTHGCSRVSRAAWTQSCWITISCHCRTNARAMQRWWDWRSWSWDAFSTPMPVYSSLVIMEPCAQACPLVVSNRKYSSFLQQLGIS